ncbi:MAG: hypothetical protein Q8876_00625, partial [Bacillota bacterium]|nr:hypothetical protein [Bacillota bacterium]
SVNIITCAEFSFKELLENNNERIKIMNLYVSDYLNFRIDEIAQNLRKTNSEYALAMEKSEELMENIDPIIHSERGITINDGDCLDFQEFFEHELTSTTIMQQELYKQGYLDCVKMLKMLGVLV